ncbi:MAG: hypothetical protein JSW27_00755 [Phycisphaerales bacterium]|nr:MAG: hypothetical protein JSW27_00755 [Phycisphaerales bacterium]
MSELTATAVERAAFECQSFAQAAAQLGVEKLVVILQNHPDLHAAWKRGRLLRKVQDLAAITVSVPQAAKELGMTGTDFRALLDGDEEVRDLWDQQRRRLRMAMAEAMVIQAKEGKPNAVRYVENFLRSEQSPVGFDYQHVPISVMVEITGKARQTLYAWTRDQGCPRNADATHNLTEFFQWYSSWQQSKVLPSHLIFQIRKAVRETICELLGTSANPQDLLMEIKTALQ